MVFANAEGINADLVGEDALVNDVADDLRVGEGVVIGAGGDIAESIQSEFKRLCHTFKFTLVCGAAVCAKAPAMGHR